MAKRWIVNAEPPDKNSTESRWDYPPGYFPRYFNFKSDAESCKNEAEEKGGKNVTMKRNPNSFMYQK